MLAGLWHWENSEVISVGEAERLAAPWMTLERVASRETSDTEACFEHLLNLIIVHNDNAKDPLIDFLRSKNAVEYKNEHLRRYGLGIHKGGLFVASRHPELERHFRETVWHTWSKTLKRMAGSEAGQINRGELRAKGVILKIEQSGAEF
jgi:hypothetical protein